jgi:hypothetical protein
MADRAQFLEGRAPWRHLVGLEHRLKDEDCVKARVAEDIRVKGRTVEEAFAVLGDAIRCTFQYPEDRYAEGVLGDLGQLAAQGFSEVRRVNFLYSFKGAPSARQPPAGGMVGSRRSHCSARSVRVEECARAGRQGMPGTRHHGGGAACRSPVGGGARRAGQARTRPRPATVRDDAAGRARAPGPRGEARRAR